MAGCNITNNAASLDLRMRAVATAYPGFRAWNQFMLITSLLLIFLFMTAWFLLKKSFPRTRVRPSILVVLQAAGAILTILIDHLPVAIDVSFPCILTALVLAHVLPLLGGGMTSRMTMFYFLSVFSQEVANTALSKMSETGFAYDIFDEKNDPVALICSLNGSITWSIIKLVLWGNPEQENKDMAARIIILKALRFITSKWGAISIVSVFTAPSIILIVAVALSTLSLPECSQCSTVTTSLLYAMVAMGLILLSVGLLMWVRVRKLPDPWGLRAECIQCLALAIVAMVCFIIEVFIPEGSARSFYFVVHLLTVSLVGVVGVSTVYQLWLGYKQESARRKASTVSSNSAYSLDAILSNPATAQAFEKHLISELGIESLLFVRDVEAWKTGYFDIAPNARKARAKKMHATYIASSGMYAVNIPDWMMREIAAGVNAAEDDVPITLFDNALKEIKHLLQVGAVARFVETPAYRKQTVSPRQSIINIQL